MSRLRGVLSPLFLSLLALIVFPPTGEARPQDSRKPVPDSAAQKKALASVKDVFKEEYRLRARDARIKLATALFDQTKDTGDDDATHYVLLDEAREIAVEAGDFPLAITSLRELAKHFEVDGPNLEYDLLSRLRRKSKTAADHKVLAKAFLDLADLAIGAEQFETARRAVSTAGTSARSAKDVNLANRAKAKAKEVSTKKRAFEKIARARKTLEKSPDDGAANTTVGRYECFEKGNWEKGLALLAKGSDKTLAELAKNDLAKPSDAKEILSVGDGWWDQAEDQEWDIKVRLHARAAESYSSVLDELSGLEKTRVSKRLAQYGQDRLGPPEQWGVPNIDGASGKATPITLTPSSNQSRVSSISSTAGQYDAVSALIRAEQGSSASAGFTFENLQKAILIEFGSSAVASSHLNKDSFVYVEDERAPLSADTEVVLSVVLEAGEYVCFVNGLEKLRIKTDTRSLMGLGLYANREPATFDNIRVRKIE